MIACMKPVVKTILGEISLRRASLDDADLVQKIMLDAAQIPLTRGLDMWGWVSTPTGEEIIRRRITQDEVYIGELNDQPIATLTVQWSDPQTWGDAGNDGAAGYVHGLSGKMYAVALMVNSSDPAAGRPALDAMVEWLAKNG